MKRKKIENCRDKAGFINLNKLENYREKGEIVEGSHAKSWYDVDGCRFLFKEYDDVLPAFGEVLYYNVAKTCGVNCAEYDFAVCNGKLGTISYDFLEPGKVYYNCLELTTRFTDSKFTLEEIKEDRDLLILHNNKYNNLGAIKDLFSGLFDLDEQEKAKIEIELVKRFCLDTIFWHRDRNLWNYGAVVNEVSDEMSLDPAHDNSYVLCLEKGEKYIESMIFSLINGERLNDLECSDSLISVSFEEDDSIEQLIRFHSESNDDMKKNIETLIGKIDPEKEVENLCRICQIRDIPRLWIKAVLNYRKITILNSLENVKINNEEAAKPNVTFSKRK